MDRIQTWLSSFSNRLNSLLAHFKRFARQALIVLGIVCGVASAAMLFGLAIDASPASNLRIGPDWQYALSDPTWWGIAEKLFGCAALGYILGIVPGGVLALVTIGWIGARREVMEEALQAHEYFLDDDMFDLVDRDKDGKIQDKDLLAFHAKVFYGPKTACHYVIKNRARIGTVEILPDGTATYVITRADLSRHPAQERERLINLEWAAVGTLLTFGVVAFTAGLLAASALLLLAEVVAFYFLLKRKVLLQRFVQREFARLDANSDGLVDELEIVQLWPKLATSERELLTKLQHRFSDYGHEVLQDGLTIRGITRLEIETCVPTLARLIV